MLGRQYSLRLLRNIIIALWLFFTVLVVALRCAVASWMCVERQLALAW
jgi:hypothetical protein